MPKVTGKSLPVRTRCTPGKDAAFEKSIEIILACGCGLRSSRMCSMRGRTMSSAKRVWPVTLARPSTRRRGLPRTFIAHPLRRFFDGFKNLLVAGTAAQVARDRLLDAVARWIRLVLEERLSGHQDARCAIAALGGAEVGEGALQRMERRPVRQALDGFNRLALALKGQHQAGKPRLAVDQHRARAALTELAAVLGAGQIEVLAQDFQQGLVGCKRHLDRLTVDRQALQNAAPH